MTSSVKKICVIGAGPIGLCTARHMSECRDAELTVFEASSQVGGLWVYEDKNEAESKYEAEKQYDNYYKINNYFHASLYPYLQSNSPYFLMCYKDLDHKDVLKNDVDNFLDIRQNQAYFDAYTDKFNLRDKIKFNTLVKSVRLYDNLPAEEQMLAPERKKFVVTTIDSKGGDTQQGLKTHSFDYVFVANGHNSKPYIPKLPGLEKFAGKIMTAKDYRQPNSEFFINKRILVLGASYSASDMVVQLFDNPIVGPQDIQHMTLVGRGAKDMKNAKDFQKYLETGKLTFSEGEIKEILDEKNIRLSDGTVQEIDTLVFCTGYELDFPFLDFEKDKLVDFNREEHRGRYMGPLYKRFVCIREPDLFFIGLVDFTNLGAFCDEVQALLAKAIIDGKYTLPSQDEMIKSFVNDTEELQVKYKSGLTNFFKLIPLQSDFEYIDDMNETLKTIYPHDEAKAKQFYHNLRVTYTKIMEFFESWNVISYKKYDFHDTWTMKNTTEFM